VTAVLAVPVPGGAAPVPTDQRINVIYDLAPIARVLHSGYPGVPGLAGDTGSHRQHPLGAPFPQSRWVGKVNHREIAGRSPRAIADLLVRRMTTSSIGGRGPRAALVGVDEIGAELQDGRGGPAFASAMRILASRTHPGTGEPMSRRVILYAAPKFVANVGANHDRGNWDAALAAARLSGGVFLQMYHASGGRVTAPMSRGEWRRYAPVWSAAMGGDANRLRFLFSGVGSQDSQWANAGSTDAGRRILRQGAGAYRLGGADTARAWLRNWNRWSVGR
jgi:hypothetical protein